MTATLFHHKIVHRMLSLGLLLIVTLTMTSLWAAPQDEEGTGIPAYNAGPPPKGTKLPAILTKDQLWGADAQYPYQTHAYDLAAKIPAVLHQQPCYCFAIAWATTACTAVLKDTHGARCATCLKELYYSYKNIKLARPLLRFVPASSRASGNRSTLKLPLP